MNILADRIKSSETTSRLISQTLVVFMMTCAAFTLWSLSNRLSPDWQPWFIPWLGFITAFERMVTYRRYRDLGVFSKEWALAVLAEWIVIILLVKTMLGLSHGLPAFLGEIPLWLHDFGKYFLSSDFLFILLLVGLTWLESGNFARVLDEMGLEQARKLELIEMAARDKPPARDRLLGLVFGTGSILIIMTAVMRLEVRGPGFSWSALTFPPISAWQAGGASTLLYFMFGLALLSQTQFMDLHTRWSLENIPVSGKLARRWAVYSLVFLAILVAIVGLLPTSYSLGLLGSLQYALNFVFGLFVFTLQAIVLLVLMLLDLIFMLFGGKPPPRAPLSAPKQPAILPQTPITASGPNAPWFELVKALLFWSFFIGIMIFSIRQYLRQHEEVLAALRKLRAANFLIGIWAWLRGLTRAAGKRLTGALEAGRARILGIKTPGGINLGSGYFSLRGLDARHKVLFFYLALVRRAGERGLARASSQTPAEYAASLDAALPGVDGEVNALTDAFVQARYSRAAVETPGAEQARGHWEHIRAALRKINRNFSGRKL